MTFAIRQITKDNLHLCLEIDKTGVYIVTLTEYGKTLYTYKSANKKNALSAFNRKRKEV